MVNNEVARFKQFSQSCGNQYLAVRIIAKWARDLGIKFKEYHISESKLIETVLSGKCFYSEYQMLKRKTISDDDHIEDFLSWILDDDVVDEVKWLYKESVKKRKLQPCKRIDFTEGKLTRVNVLLRMIWYSAD